MDSITQATLGALCGEIILHKKLGWKGAAWGALFGILPDLDILMNPWLDEMDRLRNHRGLSHSLLLMALISPLLGWLLSKIHRQISLKRATLFSFAAWSTHVLIDCYNCYGTQIFEPFSDFRVTLNNISIIDFFYTIPMLIGVIVCLFLKRESLIRTRLGGITVAWILGYTAASFILLQSAKSAFRSQLQSHGIQTHEMCVSSTLTNIFLWRMVARDQQHYYVSYWSVWDNHQRPVEIDTIARTPELAEPFLKSKTFDTLNWFSQGWWKVFTLNDQADQLYFVDMRFAEIRDGNSIAPPFIWRLQHSDGEITSEPVRLRGSQDLPLFLDKFYRRVRGGDSEWMTGNWPWEAKLPEKIRDRS